MFMLGLFGMTWLVIFGAGVGWLLSVGSVFCMHPRTSYIIGLAALCEQFFHVKARLLSIPIRLLKTANTRYHLLES
jgi:hypothetical protein